VIDIGSEKERTVGATLEDVQVESLDSRVSVVAFVGEHDLATCASVSELLGELVTTSELVVADFSAALFVDSSMLRTLIDAHARACERGATFRVQVDDDAIVRRVFEIAGVLEQIGWAPSREEALKQGGASPQAGLEGTNGRAA
jgi:anti-anti-sigma factor